MAKLRATGQPIPDLGIDDEELLNAGTQIEVDLDVSDEPPQPPQPPQQTRPKKTMPRTKSRSRSVSNQASSSSTPAPAISSTPPASASSSAAIPSTSSTSALPAATPAVPTGQYLIPDAPLNWNEHLATGQPVFDFMEIPGLVPLRTDPIGRVQTTAERLAAATSSTSTFLAPPTVDNAALPLTPSDAAVFIAAGEDATTLITRTALAQNLIQRVGGLEHAKDLLLQLGLPLPPAHLAGPGSGESQQMEIDLSKTGTPLDAGDESDDDDDPSNTNMPPIAMNVIPPTPAKAKSKAKGKGKRVAPARPAPTPSTANTSTFAILDNPHPVPLIDTMRITTCGGPHHQSAEANPEVAEADASFITSPPRKRRASRRTDQEIVAVPLPTSGDIMARGLLGVQPPSDGPCRTGCTTTTAGASTIASTGTRGSSRAASRASSRASSRAPSRAPSRASSRNRAASGGGAGAGTAAGGAGKA